MITKILDIIFPKECVSSWKKWDFLSKEEQRKLYTHPECCPWCKKNSPWFLYCRECSQTSFLQWCVIGFIYKSAIKKLLLQLKYGHRYWVNQYLSQRLALHILAQPTLAQRINEKNIIITSIPSHRRRKYFVKWYNQSELLAKEVARILNVEYFDLLSKHRRTRSQVTLSKKDRQKNLSKSFSIRKSEKNKIITNKTILLIDDIVTTWSTLKECAQTLNTIGMWNQFWWAVLARKA